MTADDFRDIVLALDGASEGAHMGHPDFRVNGRIFATLHSDDRLGMVKLSPDEQALVLREHPESFEPSAGAWGRQGCTNVTLATASRPAVRAAVKLAFMASLALPPPRARKRPATYAPTRKTATAPRRPRR
jgi:hypothetical protein